MALVKVWNDNVHDFKQKFRGNDIHIKSKQYVEMERDDAILFRGEFSPIERDADGHPLATSYKMIRIEDPNPVDFGGKRDELGCIACKFKGQDKKSLMIHMIDTHSDDLLVDEEAEAEVAAKKRGRPAKSAQAAQAG